MNIFEGLQSVSNIHPLFVHFPIGLLMTAGALFIAENFINGKELATAAKWNLALGSLFAVATVVTGFIAANAIPHNEEIHEAMEIHESIMVIMTIISLALAGYISFQKDISSARKKPVFCLGLILMMILLPVGADYGGKMVFKYGAGTDLFLKVNPEAEHGHSHEHQEGGHSHSDETDDTHQHEHGGHEH